MRLRVRRGAWRGVHGWCGLRAEARRVMRALWQRGQRGSTRGRAASEPVERALAARWPWNSGMQTPVGSRRMGLWGEPGHDAERASVAMRAASDVDPCDALPEGGDRFRGVLGSRDRCIEGGTGASQKRALVAVGQESVVADAVEAARQHVQCETA